jgi:hypothetical protein
MPLIRVEIEGDCDCGKTIEAAVGLIRGGQASVPCTCGFSLVVSAPKEKATRVGIDVSTNEAKVLQVGDDDELAPEETKH